MKKLLVSILLISISSLGAFYMFEKFLSWENYYTPFENPTTENINGYKYRFLFDEKIDAKKNQIFVIGDSFTEGASCAFKKSNLTSHIQNSLDNDIFQVINLGASGKSLPNYVDFIHFFDIDKNDKVIIILYDNDIGFSQEMCDISLRHKDKINLFSPKICKKIIKKEIEVRANAGYLRKINNYLKDFITFKMIKEALWQFPFFRNMMYRNELQNQWISFDSDENKYMMKTLYYIKKYVENKEADFYLTYFPNTNNISNNDQRHDIWLKFFQNLENNFQIEYYDPYPYFILNAPQKRMVWSLTDNHPNCEAHKIMSDFLIKSGVFN